MPLRQPAVYRAIVARHYGRALETWEVVHHINGDYTDNRPDNLMALSSQTAHMLIHHYKRREATGNTHLYPLADLLTLAGEKIIWSTATGHEAVFGTRTAVPRTTQSNCNLRNSVPWNHGLPRPILKAPY